MKKWFLFLVSVVVGLCWSVNGWGQVTLPHLDAINYTVGQGLQTQTGWTSLNSGDALLIASGNLSYTGLVASTGNKVTFDGTGIDAAKLFTQQTTGTVYYSFLLNVTSLGSLNSTGGYFSGFTEGATTTFGGTIWLRMDGTGYDIGINPKTTAGNTVWTSGTTAINTTVLVVVSYQIVTGATNDVVKLWINPTPGSTEPSATLSTTNTLADLANLNRILIRQDAATATPFVEMDELRVGTTWASVTPAAYTVVYNGNGSTGGSVPTDASSPYASGSTVTVLGNTGSLTKTGFTFNNWNTAADGSGTAYSPAATFTISANTILYAQWTAASTPTITVSPTTLTGFNYTEDAGPSGELTFTVSGTNLTNNISIAASTNYEISKTSGSGYASPLTFTQSGGTVSSTTVYVRLKSGLTAGTYNGETLNATSTGATAKTVTCSGSVVDYPNWCNVQWPSTGTITSGGNYNVYARVNEPGVTVGVGQGAGVTAWIGYSTSNTNPNTWTNWVVATYNTDADGPVFGDKANDEYVANIGTNLPAGSYFIASRFSVNGEATYSYGGYSASGGGFWDNSTYVSGTLTVNANYSDWCNLQHPETGSITVGGEYLVYARVFEDGRTNANPSAAGNNVQCWIGYNTANNNPSGWTNWIPATYNLDDGNNDEFKADIGSALPAGTYYYASRFRVDPNNEVYSYGGYNGGAWNGTTNINGVLTVTGAAGACASDLIISEYVEGSSNNKAIEIYNATGSSVDLSDYSLKKQNNGAGVFGSELILSGTLADATAYVIVNSSAGVTLLATADLSTASGSLTFNGNDAVGLFKNGTQIDEVGVENQVANWGADVTLVRKASIVDGNTVYSSSEWESYAVDTYTYLEAHTMTCGPTITVTPATLTGLNYIFGNGPSAEQSFTISGSNLTANISIAAPSNYEISSTSGSGFGNSLTLTQSGGTVNTTTIYVRLKSGLGIGTYNSEDISATSSGATNKTVTCSGSVTASQTSTLSASATLAEPATNSSIADTPAELFSVFDFTFKDDNGSGGDNIATKISQIVIKQGTGNDVSDWTKVIAYAKLVDNNNKELDGTINTTDITFSNIPYNTGTPDDLGYIADNIEKTYTLKIYFKTDFGTEKTTIDGKNLVYLVDNSCFVFADPSSNLAATQSVNSGSSNNAIAVVASKLFFTTNKPPASTITNTNTNVEVTAADENGNRDLGSTASITLSKTTGPGSVSSAAGLTKSLTAGIYSWTDFRFSLSGTYTISANDGGSLLDITSGDILVTDAPTVIWSDNCNPQHTWDVDNGSANWINISPTSNPPAYNGNCYKTAAANSQYGSSKEYILTSEVINMSDYTNCQLSFWMWMDSETNWDGGIVEVNSTSLGGWTKFNADLTYDGTVSVLSTEAWSGTKTTWQKITINLSSVDGISDLQFRFRFKTDGSVTDYGWAVDEMQVTGTYSGCAGPTVQASNLSISNVTGTSMDLTFTRGDGTGGVIVVARQDGAVNADPTSGTTYSAGNFGVGSQIGTGNWVVYKGTGNSCTVAGLSSATNYHFAIYEYNTVGTCYNRNELTGNATTICSSAINVTGATATPASTIVYLGWTNPTCYDEVMIVAKPTTTISGTPSGDGSAYTAILNYAGAGTAFDGGKVVYKGDIAPQVVYGLTNGTLYYFKIFTRKGTTWSSGIEVSATPIAGTLAANGAGTATVTNGSTGDINGTNIWQRNKTSQIANFVITGVSSGWLQNVQIDLSNFSTNLLETNVIISGNAQYGGTTITRTGEVLLINNLNLTNLNTLTVSISGLVTNNILTDTDLGNRTILVQTGNTAGTRAAIASSPVAYLTVPFANARKYTDNGTTATLNHKGLTVAVEGISTIASGRLSTNDYDQFFIQEGEGAGAKGLCIRKGSSFSPAAQIAHLYIIKGPLDLISGSVTGQTDAYKNMTAINTPTHIIDLGAATLPTPYFVYIDALYAMSYSEFEEVDGLLMRIPSVEKESGAWPALGVSSGLVRMKDVSGTNNLRCYIFGNTDVGGTEPTWPTNMATLVYNFDQVDNYRGRQITPVYKMNFFDEIIWNGSTGNGRWSDALNWSPNILPQQTDEVLFDNITGDANSYSVIYDVASMQTIKSLRINPTVPNNITVNFPNTCTFSPAITINLSGDAVIIENGGILNADFGSTTGNPLTLSASGTSGKIRINNGGRFIWKADQANEYLVDRLSTVVGTEKGIFEFDIQSSGNEAISVSDKTYGSLVLSASDGNTTYQIQGGGDAIIRGDFVINTNVTLDETWGTDFSGTILIGGNFTNNAAAWNINTTETTPDNLIILNGSAAQTISTSSTTMNVAGSGFGKKIQISNTSGGVSLASDIKLRETLTMTSGILNTGSFTVDLGTIGTLVETPINPSSYITGNVKATRNIGLGSQSFGGIGLEIEESSGSNSTVVTRVTGTQLQGNASCCSGNWSIARYFDIVPSTNSGLNASMKIYYFEHELNGVSETEMQAFKASLPFVGLSPWINMEGTGNSTDNTVRIVSLTGFSRWTVAPKLNPLPVELISFSAKCNTNAVELIWSTASEINNDYFEVQKSDNGNLWYYIGTVKGAGNSTTFNSYSFVDKENTANAYYRLRQVDFDGKFEYSPIIVGNCIGVEQTEVIVYPNPVSDIVNISIANWKSEKIHWEIVNITGQTILSGEIYPENSFAFEQINMSELKPGMYVVRFMDNDNLIIRKADKK